MNRVAERIENRGDVEIDGRGMPPDVGHRQDDVFGEGAGTVHTDTESVGAQMAAAGETVAAAATDDVPFAADDVAGMEIGDVGADLYDLADEFMADGHGDGDRLLRPTVPFVNVHVGAADAGASYADQNIINARARGVDIFEPQPRLALAFYYRFHLVLLS